MGKGDGILNRSQIQNNLPMTGEQANISNPSFTSIYWKRNFFFWSVNKESILCDKKPVMISDSILVHFYETELETKWNLVLYWNIWLRQALIWWFVCISKFNLIFPVRNWNIENSWVESIEFLNFQFIWK